jgi:hypothetical protein
MSIELATATRTRLIRAARLVWWVAALILQPGRHAAAQDASGSLVVSVVDPSGAAIGHASVGLKRQDDISATPSPLLSPSPGVFVANQLRPGRYAIRAEATGFVTTIVSLRVDRSREARRTIRLPLEPLAETIVVARDPQSAAIDPRGFSTFLSRDQIDALPDDPEAFARALQALAPPGAVIRIDGFTGGVLPPKSQILSIRIPRLDTFAAQDHGGLSGLSFIDLVTRPGGGRLAGSGDLAARHGALDARNALASEKGPQSLAAGSLALDGPVLPGSLSFSAAVRAVGQRDTATVHAALPDGTTLTMPVPRPQDSLTVSARLASVLRGDQTLRVSFSSDRRSSRNLGVGATGLPERAYDVSTSELSLRAAGGGPLGGRAFLDVRAGFRRAGSRSRSAVEMPTIHVLDAFSSGGAQQAGGTRADELEAAVDLDYGWKTHAIRVGALLEHGRFHSRRLGNYLGTYTFASLDDFAAGLPTSFTKRTGNPEVRYQNAQVALYAQDDIRLARSLLVSVGARAERQSLVSDTRLLPRAGLTWSPFRTGATTVRAGFGLFADWLPTTIYEQSLAVDGTRQRDTLILWPSYPHPPESDTPQPLERYAIAPNMRLQTSIATSVAVEHRVAAGFRVYASYGQRAGHGLLRGRNLNAPVDGLRPDPLSGNILEAWNDGASRSRVLVVQALASVQRRAELTVVYAWNDARADTAGAFAAPASLTHDDEWGPTSPAHTATTTMTARLPAGLHLTVTPQWRSGSPYSVTTGRDDNRDGLFTDRPPGIARNSERTPPQWEIGARLAFVTRFGRSDAIVLPSAGSDLQSMRAGAVAFDRPDDPLQAARYRLEIFAAAQNLTNHVNYVSVGGVAGSPFFGRPTAAGRARQVQLGVRFGF